MLTLDTGDVRDTGMPGQNGPVPSLGLELMQYQLLPVPILTMVSSDPQNPRAAGGSGHPLVCVPSTTVSRKFLALPPLPESWAVL